ncbi:Thimet oligopeptidase [Rhodotorula toruloides]|nr:Thimet oligopeptidase [Rhodotorula toruloides]
MLRTLLRHLNQTAARTARSAARLHFTPAYTTPRTLPAQTRQFSNTAHPYSQPKPTPIMPAADPSTYPRPPVPPPRWTSYDASRISSLVDSTLADANSFLDSTLADANSFLDSLVAVPKEQRTFESIVRPLAIKMGEVDREIEPGLFMQYVHPSKEIRDASVEADKKAQEWSLEMLTRLDIYEALLDAQAHTEKEGVKLNDEEKRLLERLVLERKRNGLGLSAEKRKEYLELKKKIMGLEIEFQRACNEENGFLLFTKEELEGVPADVLSGYDEVEEGGVKKLKVTHKTPDITPIFKYAANAETRKRANLSYEAKTLANASVLSDIVKLRHEAAQLLGYKNHAEWVLEVKMAKKPSEVHAFLEDLESKLRPLGLKERETLLALKKEECEQRGWPFDDKFNLWDYRYYDRLHVEKTLDLDDNLVKEYFPVSHIVPAILDVYKELLGVELIPVPKTQEAGGETWHADADMYAVWEAGQAGKDGAFLGYMHLDLFPRANKYGHAAVFPLLPAYTSPEHGRQYPVVAMVANLSKPTPGRPATMKHGDVVTFFHEAGHAYHGLLSKTQFARFHGTAVARDFVEAPSQMLENWCWEPHVLRMISSHYETGKSLPQDLIDKLIKSRTVGQGLFNLRQLFFGKYDMALHTDKYNLLPDEMSKLWCDLRKETSLVTIGDEVVGGQSGFAHIAGGYSAGYYGYLWSQVFSADMYETVFSKDPMSKEGGQRYRKEILQPGGSRDEMDSLVKFLGRKPTNDAFLKSLLACSSRALTPSQACCAFSLLPKLRLRCSRDSGKPYESSTLDSGLLLLILRPSLRTPHPLSLRHRTMPSVDTEPARPSLRKAIAQLPLPSVPALSASTWRTHSSFHSARSWAFEAPEGEGILDYERAEARTERFLTVTARSTPFAQQHVGDALLGAEIALLIDEQYPRLVTGVRSLVKACLVENITLAQISQRLGLPEQILCSYGQGASIRANPGVQACVFEAFLFSLHAEQGAEAMRTFIRAIYSPLLPATVEALRPLFVSVSSTNGAINYVGQLMEWSMKKGCPGRSVQFSQSQRSGNLPRNPSWVVECTVSDAASGIGGQTFVGTGTTIAKAKNDLNRLPPVRRGICWSSSFPQSCALCYSTTRLSSRLIRPSWRAMASSENSPASSAVSDAVAQLPLPAIPALDGAAWCTHTSFYGARHQPFEANAGEDVLDYERLELVKSDLVSNQTLALISSRLGFPSQLRAAAAQLYQLRNNPLVQAALFEAYLAQLHVEKGHTAFQSFVTSLYSPLVPVVVQASRSAQPAPLTTALIGLVNYVGILMEWTQRTRGRDGRTVTFAPSRCGGADHKPLWVASCKVEESKMRGVTDLSTYEGMGSSVAEAKRDAAYQACLDLGLA